jgi:lipoprotein signal peptidase
MAERSFRALLWTLALVGLTLDLGSKYAVFGWLAEVPDHSFVVWGTRESGFSLTAQFESADSPHVNQGALFGIKVPGLTPRASNYFFAAVSLLAAAAIVAWSFQGSTAADGLLCAALGLILAGTLGNFYDRIVFLGVRDFLHWNYGFDWPVFNIADCCLVTGAGLLLFQTFFLPPATEPVKQNPESSPADASGSPATLRS